MFSKKSIKEKDTNELNVVTEIDNLINKAIEIGASDIHIEPRERDIRIRYRLDGKLFRYCNFEKTLLNKFTTRIKIMAELNVAEKRVSQDGGFKYSYSSKDVDIRVSTILTIYGEKIVLRILDKDDSKIKLSKLGIIDEDIEIIRKIISIENGLIYLVGPTGCGKSTTLYSIIKELNDEFVNIITVEDPVEFKIDGVNQIQVNEEAGITFSNTLRSILRQDPEIILVGETRDKETAEMSIRSSITGHRVFSTLHTNDSYSAIIRLLDMNIDDYLIRASLRGVVSQRLVRILCPHCKTKVKLTDEQKDILKNIDSNFRNDYVYEAVGCSKCNNGYHGRKAIMEILYIDRDFRKLIKYDLDLDELRNLGKEKNIKTIVEKGVAELENGIISFNELMDLSLNTEIENEY